MVVITWRFTQSAALVFEMNLSCITTQQIVYSPVDIPSSVSTSGSKSGLWWLSWAYESRWNHSVEGNDVCKYTDPASTLIICECWALGLLPGRMGGITARAGIPGRGGIGAGVVCLRLSGEGTAVPFRLQCVFGFYAVRFWPGRHTSIWFWRSIARYLFIAFFTCICPGNSTPNCISSRTFAWSI
jgi:hypothetical protein